ncbi:hypothetical protein C8255_27025 [filamentous cyanobacterium CCP3]|nr:hypothetical protein C8255_27025 [filamentous cyanobacterium CCP3]
MGTKYNFACPGCGYIAEWVSGQRDFGEMAVVRTVICEDCKAVVDVLIGQYGQDGLTGDPDYDKSLNLCPKCEGTRLYSWSSKHPCPKCDDKMLKDDTFGEMLWD